MATTKKTLDIPAPRPWRVDCDTNNNPRFPRIRDANGLNIIVSNDDTGRIKFADAALIVEAVNAYKRRAAGKWRISEKMNETIVDELNRVQASAANAETADLIVDAVNERDRLRDLVARLAEYIRREGSREVCVVSTRPGENYHVRAADLLREAEAALAKEAQA